MKSIELFRAHVLHHSSSAEKLGQQELASKIIGIKRKENEAKILFILSKKNISTRQMKELQKRMQKHDKYIKKEARIHNTKRNIIVPQKPSAPNTEDIAPALPPRTYKNKTYMDSFRLDAIGEKQQLLNKLSRLQTQLNPCFCPERYQQGGNINRFHDIQANKSTIVCSELNANYIKIGTYRSIACQYPLESQLEKHLHMLFDNRTPVLAVLASDEEISERKNKMPDYFRQSGSYGAMNVQSKLSECIELSNGIYVDIYQMKLTQRDSGRKGITIPVIHIRNWPDKQTLSMDNVNEVSSLIAKNMRDKVAMYVKSGSSAVGDVNKLLPVVHCRAGVGRTGLIIGSLAMNEKANVHLSLEDVIAEMRLSRNGLMVQTSDQLDELVKIAQRQGRALLSNVDYSAC